MWLLFWNLQKRPLIEVSLVLSKPQWSMVCRSVFLFYNLTTPIKRKLPILHIVNGQWSAGQSFCFITWQHLLRGSFLSFTLLMVNGLCQSFCFITWQHLLRGSFLSSTLLMVNGLCQSFCFITWQHLLRGSFLSSTLLMVNGLCQSFCFITWQHLLRGSFLSSTLLMVNGLCQSFCFISWQHLLRGSFLSSTLLFNGQWSVSVFLFYKLTTPIKRKLPILHIVI